MPNPLPRNVTLRLVWARWGLIWARVWSAMWPASGILGVFLIITLMEGWHWLPSWLHTLSLVGFLIGFVYALWHSFSRVTWPTRADAIRHMEIKSNLAHRPISSYEDRAAKRQGHELDKQSQVLWDRHQDRLREQIRSVRAGWPNSDLPRQDQTALRFLIALLLLLAVIRSGLDFPDKLKLAFNPTMPSAVVMAVTVDAWINPPAYTGIAPIFLTRPEFLDQVRLVERFEVPEGSQFYVRVQGTPVKPELIATTDGQPPPSDVSADIAFADIGEQAYEYSQVLNQDTEIRVASEGDALGSWSFKVRRDHPPAIAFGDELTETNQHAIKIPFTVVDDYGVVVAKAVIDLGNALSDDALNDDLPPRDEQQLIDAELALAVSLPDTSGPLVLDLPLPSLRTARSTETAYEDLTAHPWAGLDVTVQLFAEDEAAQTGASERVDFVLPERIFTDPLARAIIEQRKWLALHPSDIYRVARHLDAVSQLPERYFDDYSVYLSIRVAYWRLKHAKVSADLDGMYELLWDIAIRLEDGDLSEMAQALRNLQQRLMAALNQGGTQDEIDKIMQALREAMQNYLAQLFRDDQQLREQGQRPPNMGNMGNVSNQDIQDLLDAIEDRLRAGDMETARQLLAQLMDRLESIEAFNRSGQGGQGGQGGAPQNDALGRLGDMIGRQRGLLDETFRQARPGQPQNPGRPGQPGQSGELGEPGDDGTGQGGPRFGQDRSNEQLTDDQQALREELDQLLDSMREQGLPVPDELERAGRAMGDSRDELEGGDLPGAIDPQKEAIDQLRQGSQQLAQQMLDDMMERQGLANQGSRNGEDPRDYDPLGRPSATAGPEYGDMVKVPDGRERQRARDILEELRRRAGELDRPPMELDYLERLLKRF